MRDIYDSTPPYNQRRRHRRSRREALPLREITIALIIVLLILSAILIATGFVLLNMATGEW